MGLQPIVRNVPTNYEALRRLYVEGKIDLDKFEEVVGGLLAKGIENDPVEPRPPPKPSRIDVRPELR